ncbi:MAG: FISUMP domain-containing protein [Melioribacteraceae bacterium]|nr:FISUMP domain-containing protein [Melioribacteraceae bacterium]
MKKIVFLLVIFCFTVNPKAQTITGKMIDHNGKGLSDLNLQLYINPTVYNTTSGSDGSFTFSNITGVKEEELPAGYAVSNNYPNPFNPKTRIGISLPHSGNVKVEVFNLLGQLVCGKIEKYSNTGESFIDLDLHGLSNGIYLARVTLDDKYSTTKKLMLVYGSQHLSSSSFFSFTPLNKTTLDGKSILATKIDSLIVTSAIVGRKTFKGFLDMVGNSYNLGNLVIERFCSGISNVTYDGKTYETVKIGNQCWLRRNLDVGYHIQGLQSQTNNHQLEKYCYNNEPINCELYGGLYQWNEAMQYVTTPGSQGICPTGWHIPTLTEYQILASIVGNDANLLKAVGQGTGDGAGTNSSGFTGLLGGYRLDAGHSNNLQQYGAFWSSSEASINEVNSLYLVSDSKYTSFNVGYKAYSYSVRCIRNESLSPSAPTLLSPINNAVGISVPPTLEWNASTTATSYRLQVSTNNSFTSFIYNEGGLTNTNLQLKGVSNNTTYYWRVNATNSYGTSDWSTVWSFTTQPGSFTCGDQVNYSGKTYNTVLIGTQCWFKENLDVGSMIQGIQNSTNNGVIEKYCYNDEPNNCQNGGLYQWNEAMQYKTAPGGQGICPTGWHIPTITEFQTLSTSVNNNGNALKAIGQGTGSGAGTNTSGFSGLIAGCRAINGIFGDFNFYGYFQSSTEFGSDSAHTFDLGYYSQDIYFDKNNKELGFSVRCIKDGTQPPNAPTLSLPTNNSTGISTSPTFTWGACPTATGYALQVSVNNSFTSFIYNQNGLTNTSQQVTGLNNNTTYYWRVSATNNYGTSDWSSIWSFTTMNNNACPGIPIVTYAGKIYNTVQIGTQCWLKENLDVGTIIMGNQEQQNNGVLEKYCYDNNPGNCNTYGGFYQWAEAVQYKNGATNTTFPSPSFSGNVQGICPPGWHLPTIAEFQVLIGSVGNDGNKLKAVGQGSGEGVGTNTTGFSALMTGIRNSNGIFSDFSNATVYWSSTQGSNYDGASDIILGSTGSNILENNYGGKSYGHSVRCLKD